MSWKKQCIEAMLKIAELELDDLDELDSETLEKFVTEYDRTSKKFTVGVCVKNYTDGWALQTLVNKVCKKLGRPKIFIGLELMNTTSTDMVICNNGSIAKLQYFKFTALPYLWRLNAVELLSLYSVEGLVVGFADAAWIRHKEVEEWSSSIMDAIDAYAKLLIKQGVRERVAHLQAMSEYSILSHWEFM